MDLRAQAGVARLLGAAAAGAVVALALEATGDEGREIVRLEIASAPGCPDRASFEARVLARTTRAVFVAADGAAARTFRVALDATPRPHGRLTVSRAGRVEGTRDVDADSCSDVAEVLALAAALAIDPALPTVSAPVAGAPPTALSAAPPPSAAPSPSASPSASASAVPPAPPSPPAPSSITFEPLEPPPAAEAPPRPPPRLPHTLSVGADFAAATGVTPQTLTGVSPSLGWRAGGASILAPSVTAAFLRASSGTLPVTGGAAAFTWTVGRLDGCPLSWPPGAARLLACVRLEAGLLEAAGSEVPSPQSRSRAWFAAGPLARAEWELLAPLFVEAQAAAMVHVTADHFLFLPDTTVYQVPLVGLEASAGLGAHFL
jgi:hypothetical protein